jgi:lipoprotein Spr/probable lipoprotein NlpC
MVRADFRNTTDGRDSLIGFSCGMQLTPRGCVLLLAGLICLVACGCSTGKSPGWQASSSEAGYSEGSYYSWVRDLLYEQFQGWSSVGYRYGGLSKKGVDCSGFVYLTYLRRFRVSLPRTADQQLRYGRRVAQSELRPGDLVFFDTGWKSIHVGIYLDKGRFMHSSKSQGVTISRLQQGYWAERHFRSIRILADI